MDVFTGLFFLFLFVCFVALLVILFLLRRVRVLQWQLEARWKVSIKISS